MHGQDVGSIRASASLGDSSSRSDKTTTSSIPPNPAIPPSFPFSEGTTVSFLADESLTSLERGFGVESDIFPLCGKKWQVVLYPYGQRKDGPPFGFKGVNGAFRPTHASYGRIGVYLRYVPDGMDDFADCVFTLALKGQQQSGPRFDVAFDCGMRFASAQNADTSSGVASDWGAHVAPSSALADFTRTTGNGAGEVSVQVNVTVYGVGEIGRDGGGEESEEGVDAKVGTAVLKLLTPGMDSAARRKLGVFWRLPSDVRSQLRVGQVVIPTTLTGNNGGEWMKVRDRMFEVGAYPGVEYRIMGMRERGTGRVLFKVPNSDEALPPGTSAVHPEKGEDGGAAGADGSGSGVDLVIRPIYPLEKRLERQWPVTVAVDDVPSYLTQAMYNSLTLIGTAAWSASLILLILLGREAISFYKIPTASMEPTISRGDLILAEKLTPRFRPPSRGEVILFNPPQGLRDVVESQGGTLGSRDLFVKRVAATPVWRPRHPPLHFSPDLALFLSSRAPPPFPPLLSSPDLALFLSSRGYRR